jgi:hypothetical protein
VENGTANRQWRSYVRRRTDTVILGRFAAIAS